MDTNQNFSPLQPQNQSNGMAVAGFVLALIGLFLSWVPGLCWILWILGLVFSCIGLKKKPMKGLAIAGLVISVITLIILIWMLAVAGAIFGAASAVNDSTIQALDSAFNQLDSISKM